VCFAPVTVSPAGEVHVDHTAASRTLIVGERPVFPLPGRKQKLPNFVMDSQILPIWDASDDLSQCQILCGGQWCSMERDMRMMVSVITRALLLVAALSVGGCSVRGVAVETIGDMLSAGSSAFADEDDIELVGEALPFSLKLTDSLLQESPEHHGLLRAAARAYVLYSYAYVHFPAEKATDQDLERARKLRGRARKLYLRAFDYAIRGLEIDWPGIGPAILDNPSKAVARIDRNETDAVPFLYWAASALGLAITVSKDDPAMLARLPEVEAMLQHALVLDETFDSGALHEFALILAAAAPRPADRSIIDHHYGRALELSERKRASLYVAYAMAVPLRTQDREKFRALIEKALAIAPDEVPGQRLQTAITHRRARWLLSRTDELFLK